MRNISSPGIKLSTYIHGKAHSYKTPTSRVVLYNDPQWFGLFLKLLVLLLLGKWFSYSKAAGALTHGTPKVNFN